MQVWRVIDNQGKKKWKKQSVPKAHTKPLIETLLRLIRQRRGGWWLVFSHREAAVYEAAAKLFYASPALDAELDRIVEVIQRERPYIHISVTRVSQDPNLDLIETLRRPCHLAIHCPG